MTLRRKMALQILAMIVGQLLVSGFALWGMNGLHQDYGLALQGYQEIRHAYTVGSHLATAKLLLGLSPANDPDQNRQAAREIRAAKQELTLFDEPAPTAATPSFAPALASIRSALAATDESATAEVQQDAVDRALHGVADLGAEIRAATEGQQRAAHAKRRQTILIVTWLSSMTVAIAIGLGIIQYRSVSRPLQSLSDGVRRVAAGQFDGWVRGAEGRRDEFSLLARDFNRMANELDNLYRNLEQKVQTKSRELVRSERLAGVGFLAAGIAHEINNPLGIIAGYAEYSLTLPRNERAGDELEKNLRVICDEAFRCKQITEKLLSLARPGEAGPGGHEPAILLSPAPIAADVASILGGLETYRNRSVIVSSEADQDLSIRAVENEIKQVLLNLTLNALEAVGSGGEVCISICRRGGWVELSVSDNGRGMSRQTLERVFEPFFSERRIPSGVDGSPDAERRGTGLGLSITRAIVESCGGTIEAFSGGAGCGSRFVITLPAADSERDANRPSPSKPEDRAAPGRVNARPT